MAPSLAIGGRPGSVDSELRLARPARRLCRLIEAAVARWAGADHRPKSLPKRRYGRHSNCRGYPLDRGPRGFQQLLRPDDSLFQDPSPWARATLLQESAMQGAHAHGVTPRNGLQLQLVTQVSGDPRLHGADGTACRRRYMANELGLPTGTLERDDGESCRLRGNFRTEILANHMQAQVCTGAGAGRGQEVLLVDEQHIGLNLDPGESARELGSELPVGGGLSVIQKAGGRQDKCPTTDGCNSLGAIRCNSQRADDGWRNGPFDVVQPGHQYRIRIGQRGHPGADPDAAAGAAHHALRPTGYHPVKRAAVASHGAAEQFDRYREIPQHDAGEC